MGDELKEGYEYEYVVVRQFTGSWFWLVVLTLLFIPFGIIYFFVKYQPQRTKVLE